MPSVGVTSGEGHFSLIDWTELSGTSICRLLGGTDCTASPLFKVSPLTPASVSRFPSPTCSTVRVGGVEMPKVEDVAMCCSEWFISCTSSSRIGRDKKPELRLGIASSSDESATVIRFNWSTYDGEVHSWSVAAFSISRILFVVNEGGAVACGVWMSDSYCMGLGSQLKILYFGTSTLNMLPSMSKSLLSNTGVICSSQTWVRGVANVTCLVFLVLQPGEPSWDEAATKPPKSEYKKGG